MWRKKGRDSVARLLPRECWKSYCELEQSILLNKGFDERRGSVLIWIRNLCLCAPFLSRLPSTTPLWFKALFGFSSASQVITFQHVAPFTGELTTAVISLFPTCGDSEEQEKKRCLFLKLFFAHGDAVWMCPLTVLSAGSSLIADELRGRGDCRSVDWASFDEIRQRFYWNLLLSFCFPVKFISCTISVHGILQKRASIFQEIFSKLPKFKVIS